MRVCANHMEMIVLIGPQGAGKSSFCVQRLLNSHVRISLDLLRTRHRESQFVALCLRTQQRLVIDNTNPLRSDRQRYLEPALKTGYRCVAHYFLTPLPQALLQNATRIGKARVPDKAIVATSRRLEPPSFDEGFTAIFEVRPDSEAGFSITERHHANG